MKRDIESTYEEVKAAATDFPDMSGDVAAFAHGQGVSCTAMRRVLNRLVREGVMVREGRAADDRAVYSVKPR